MKRFIYYTLICCASVALGACSHTDELDSIQNEGGKITIATSLGDQVVTRAADTNVERKVKHIDVFVVKSDGTDAGSIVHYERSTQGNNNGASDDGAGSLTLSISRANAKFEQNAKYTFYLVANATIATADAAAITTLSALESWMQSDAIDNGGLKGSWLHVTGTLLGGGTPPDSFLMQAIAGDAAGQVVNSASGNGEKLALSASLERAAAKIVVNISQGADTSFYEHLSDGAAQGNALYYFNMLPVKSFVLPKNTVALAEQELVTTVDLGPNNNTFIWTPQSGSTTENPNHKIQIVGYAYAHSWGEIDPQDATSLIVNIPIKWNKNGNAADGNEFVACNSWYKIPLSKNKKFERNKCYEVDVVINTAGADDRTSVVELEDINFTTLPWIDVDIAVGSTSRPEYLTLNTDVVKIYNANSDDTQLSFTSSSPIKSITLKDIDDASFSTDYRGDGNSAYYKNKYSQIIKLGNDVRNTISASAPANMLNGAITINSPIVRQQGSTTVETHYNTIRYLEFEVENEQGLKADFRVEQYPLIYITNIVGWYSYRDDFVSSGQTLPTTYEVNRGGVISLAFNNYNSNQLNYTYYTNFGGSYGWYSSGINGFWGSKVNRDVESVGDYEDDQSSYDIDYYRWDGNNRAYINQSVGGNARMYHVRVTATSTDYTVARPKFVDASGNETTNVENGFTDSSDANSVIVSPSFMIASQLGFVEISRVTLTSNEQSYAIARDHCKNYVEVSADGKVYNDWRLPTEAEIGIILGLQGTSSGDNTKAIDYLLSAGGYFSGSGVVSNPNGSGNAAIRCIRDAYDVNDR